MSIPHVKPGKLIAANHQNLVIAQVNHNTETIANLSAPGGDLGAVQDMIDDSVTTHVQAAEPHPAYDDMPSLTLIFENGLV